VQPNLLRCDDKQPRKLQQYLAIDAFAVMPIDLDSVSGKEVIDPLRRFPGARRVRLRAASAFRRHPRHLFTEK
jgi:hypothetical protein